jgi:hypothetical protein
MSVYRQSELTLTFCLDKTWHRQQIPTRDEDTRMAGPPSYPDTGSTGEDTGTPPGPRPGGRSRLRTAVVAILVIAALAVMVILHLTGTLGAGTHG